MDISAIIKAVLTPHEDRPGTQLLEMKPGDQISGRVLKIANDGRVLMDLGGRRAFAQIGFPVKIGQRLQLQVVTTGSVLHLKAETGRGSKGTHPMPAIPDFSGAINHEDQKRLVEILGRLAKGGHGVTTGDGTTANIRTTLQQLTTIFETIPMADSTQRISRWLIRLWRIAGSCSRNNWRTPLRRYRAAPAEVLKRHKPFCRHAF